MIIAAEVCRWMLDEKVYQSKLTGIWFWVDMVLFQTYSVSIVGSFKSYIFCSETCFRNRRATMRLSLKGLLSSLYVVQSFKGE